MKKYTILEIILGVIGVLTFTIGICMCLIDEWSLLTQGIMVSIIGVILLLCIIPLYRKEHPKQKTTDWGKIFAYITGIIGTAILIYALSKMQGETTDKTDMIIGMVSGIVGFLICILNYPIYLYLNK